MRQTRAAMPRTSKPALALLLLLCCACSGPRTDPEAARGEAAGGGVVRVVFSLPGDDIGSPESAALLERVTAAILERGVGEVLGSGFGMGSMELVVRLRGESARAALAEAVRQAYPTAKFRIEPKAPRGPESGSGSLGPERSGFNRTEFRS